MDQLIDHLYLSEGEVAQDVAASQNVYDLVGDSRSIYEQVAAVGTSKEHWHLIFDTIASGIVLINANIQIVEANRAARQILGMDLETMQQYIFASNTKLMRPDGTPLPREEWQTAMVFRTGQAQHHALEGFVRPNVQ